MDRARLIIDLNFGGCKVRCISPTRGELDEAEEIDTKRTQLLLDVWKDVPDGASSADWTAEQLEEMSGLLERAKDATIERIHSVTSPDGEVWCEGDEAKEWVRDQGLLRHGEDIRNAFQEVYFRRWFVPRGKDH